MCGGGPQWKREIVPDHKFDFVDTREFIGNGSAMRLKYLWLYVIVLKSFLVYVSDIFTAITMLTTKSWSNQIFNDCKNVDGCIPIPFDVGKWLFVGCIIFSFLLLAYETRKTKKIIASRDISYAFTNVMANHYYSLRSYAHFCFFDHISNSAKKKDDFAFFIFFTFKSWKRVLLADGPRQAINALTLYSIYLSKEGDGQWYYVPKYFQGNSLATSLLTVSTFFTVVVFAGSLITLIVAGIFYIPLLCYIQGNLKEYVCHKVDKRIAEVIRRRNKERLARAAELAKKEAMGDFSHLKNKKGELIAKPLPQPTLPNLSVDDDIDDASSMQTRVPINNYQTDYPPTSDYNQPYSQYNSSQATFVQDDYQRGHIYGDDHESTIHLSSAAAPFGQAGEYPSAVANHGYYLANPHDVYQGRAVPTGGDFSQRSLAPSAVYGQSQSPGLPYDGLQDYPSPTSGGPSFGVERQYDSHQGGGYAV